MVTSKLWINLQEARVIMICYEKSGWQPKKLNIFSYVKSDVGNNKKYYHLVNYINQPHINPLNLIIQSRLFAEYKILCPQKPKNDQLQYKQLMSLHKILKCISVVSLVTGFSFCKLQGKKKAKSVKKLHLVVIRKCYYWNQFWFLQGH